MDIAVEPCPEENHSSMNYQRVISTVSKSGALNIRYAKKNLCIYLHEVIELQVDGHHEEGLVVLLLEAGVDPVSLREGELGGGLGVLVRIAGRVVRDDIAEGSQVTALQAREGVGLKERVSQFYSFVYVEILR